MTRSRTAEAAAERTERAHRRDPGERVSAVADLTLRLAVLLSAGIPPPRVWELLAEAGEPVARAVAGQPDSAAALIRATASTGSAERHAWRALAAAWAVAERTGAPLAMALRTMAHGISETAESQRERAAALAGPAATARIVLALPAFGLVLSGLLGLGAIELLVASPLGWACLGVGTLLLLGARAWSRRLVALATRDDPAAGLDCELAAIALSSGTSLDRALAATDDALARAGIAVRSPSVERVLAMCARAGAPAVELLRAEASRMRARSRSQGKVAAAQLAVRLMLPLGVCVLPSFVAVGVVPVLLSVLVSTFRSLA